MRRSMGLISIAVTIGEENASRELVNRSEHHLRKTEETPLRSNWGKRMQTRISLLAATFVLSSHHCGAGQVVSDWTRITQIRTGWVIDTMAVFTQAPLANPGCTVTNAGYVTDPADSGHQLFHSVLLAAFINGKEVQITAAGCIIGDKPRIIGVDVR
jgi:hypothetical protein